MIYPYECQCGETFEVAKALRSIDDPEHCPSCNQVARRVIGLSRIQTVEQAAYNPAFGKVIRNKAHLRDELKKKKDQGCDMIEVGDEPVDKLHKHFETVRKTKQEKSWSEPVEKILYEARNG